MTFKLALVFHLLGICNWFGSAGVQVFFLSSFKKGKEKDYVVWSEKMAHAVTKSMEVPGMILAALTGAVLLFLRSGQLSIFSERWFQIKMALVLALAAQTFYELRATGQIVELRAQGQDEESITKFKKKYLLWGKVITLIALGAFYFAVYNL